MNIQEDLKLTYKVKLTKAVLSKVQKELISTCPKLNSFFSDTTTLFDSIISSDLTLDEKKEEIDIAKAGILVIALSYRSRYARA